MKVLILGHLGRMGKRYGAILTRMGAKWDGRDLPEYLDALHDILGDPLDHLDRYTHIIIATPTHTHKELIVKCLEESTALILCEKPLCANSKDTEEISEMPGAHRVSVVCNWAYVLPWELGPEKQEVIYGNWHTGNDGVSWDCCQLHYLSKNKDGATVGDDMLFCAFIDGFPISLTDIDRSYIAMMLDFVNKGFVRFGINDALAMEQKVERIICQKRS